MKKIKKIWEFIKIRTEILGRYRFAAVAATLALIVFIPVAFLTRSLNIIDFGLDVCPEYNVPVESGDTLSSLLGNFGMRPIEIAEIDKTLKKDAKIRSLQAGKDNLKIFKRDTEPVERVVLNCGPWRDVNIERDTGTGQWTAQIFDRVPEIRIVRKSGVIQDGDSFYAAGNRASIPIGIITEMYDLFSFEIDFERDVRAGQEFNVLYEEFYSGGKLISPGSVVFSEFDTMRGKTTMYRFRAANGRIGYYDAEGKGAIKSLKRTPINNARVTSSFSNRRKHPVLGFTRAHRGVDFRASTGTPIPAAGAGKVVRRGFDKGYGNFIQIRHGGSFETLYAHMSRHAAGAAVGNYVKQGQIVGYVGSTGISTGPHLHYEIIQNGVKVNPLSVKLPAISNLSDDDLAAFQISRQQTDDILGDLRPNDQKSYWTAD